VFLFVVTWRGLSVWWHGVPNMRAQADLEERLPQSLRLADEARLLAELSLAEVRPRPGLHHPCGRLLHGKGSQGAGKGRGKRQREGKGKEKEKAKGAGKGSQGAPSQLAVR
jgi:hypothetical protein